MAFYEIKIFDEGSRHYETSVTLDDQVYRFNFYGNKPANSWYVDLRSIDNEPLVMGYRLAAGTYLFLEHRYKPIPPGVLWVETTEITGPAQIVQETDPVLDSFEKQTHTIMYAPQSEIDVLSLL